MIASNPVKARLREGGVSLGSFCLEFRTPGIGRLAAAAGAEFLIYDMEHSGWSTETIAWLAATSGSELVPVVRVPSIEANSIAPVLDSGAAGIM
ncbi:MAG: aldolase, partial [Actinomycetota bacterium]|nr:aldolase [Actinomycetota bacterium]